MRVIIVVGVGGGAVAVQLVETEEMNHPREPIPLCILRRRRRRHEVEG